MLEWSRADIIAQGHNELGHGYGSRARKFYKGADNTQIWRHNGHNFNYQGTVYTGSDINYIHVGMMMSANGVSYDDIAGASVGRNAWEAITSIGTSNFNHEFEQMSQGTAYSLIGARYWNIKTTSYY